MTQCMIVSYLRYLLYSEDTAYVANRQSFRPFLSFSPSLVFSNIIVSLLSLLCLTLYNLSIPRNGPNRP